MVCEEFGIKESTFCEICKAKDKLCSFPLICDDPNSSQDGSASKRMRKMKYSELDKTVYKWYKQERSVGVSIRGVDIQSATQWLASQMGMSEYPTQPFQSPYPS